MYNPKVTNLINKAMFQDCLEDALIFLEDAYKAHNQPKEGTINIEIGTVNLEILSPSNLAVKELKKEVLR